MKIGATATVGTGLPGRFGVDYDFINQTAVDVYVDTNHVCSAVPLSPFPHNLFTQNSKLTPKSSQINLFRVAFLLERMCPLSYGLGSKFNETHYGFYADAINYITVTKGAYAILDPHNYMRYNNPSQQPATGSVIGNTSDPTAATTAQFAAFWGELAGRFKDNSKVIFGLMNEVSCFFPVR